MTSELGCHYFAKKLAPHVEMRRYWDNLLIIPFIPFLAITAAVLPPDPSPDYGPPPSKEEMKALWEDEQQRYVSEGYETLEEQVAFSLHVVPDQQLVVTCQLMARLAQKNLMLC